MSTRAIEARSGSVRDLSYLPGVLLVDLERHVDDRGYLFEVLHDVDPWVSGTGEAIRQVYVVGDPARGAVRAFHRHARLHDWFCVVSGSAVFALVDGRPEEDDRPIRLTLSASKPQLLVVPPGVWHGWMALEDHTVLLSCASHIYNRDCPDEERCPSDDFDGRFGGSPWAMRPR